MTPTARSVEQLTVHLQDLVDHFPRLRVSLEALARGEIGRIVVKNAGTHHAFRSESADGDTDSGDDRAQQLRLLAARLTAAEQRERRRMSQFLHDELQQFLVAARLKLGMARHRVKEDELTQLLGQIDELLKSSIQASRSLSTELSPSILYEAGLVAAVEWLIRQFREKHGLEIEGEFDADVQPADETMSVALFGAVRELLLNVVKHANVARALVRVRRLDDTAVEIVVSDQGSGFPMNRAGLGNSRDGLGLFGLRERLAVLGVDMRMTSEPDRGTQVTLTAPVGLARPEQTEPSQQECQPVESSVVRGDAPVGHVQNKIRVLLADDHEIVREGLSGILSDESDMEVVGEAADGRTAVEHARRLEPDVIIMDVTMPGINGIEATRQIAAALPNVRIIGLSAHEEEDMASAIIKAGASAFLSKGGPSHDLIAIIRSCCANSGSNGAKASR